ncbi:hypothetical protein [Arthrobacter sp. R-11]|uniref:hypothetical protein n=1 Tax=Arthrobacter sp. R-11 TaxID=3404053 RepID=UPI003CEF61CD
MTEVPAHEETNLDDWLDGIQRTERSVTLYGRADLLADIDVIEAKKRQAAEIPEEERSMADKGPDVFQSEIDALYLQLDASKLEFRVTFIDDEEQEEITAKVKEDLKETADKAAAAARAEAREKCRRLEIKQPNDINTVSRTMANAAIDKVIEREVSIRTIAAVTRAVLPGRTEPVPLSVEQVRKLYTKVGDSQIALLSQAYSRAAAEAPQVAVPKSSRPSPSHDGPTSS